MASSSMVKVTRSLVAVAGMVAMAATVVQAHNGVVHSPAEAPGHHDESSAALALWPSLNVVAPMVAGLVAFVFNL